MNVYVFAVSCYLYIYDSDITSVYMNSNACLSYVEMIQCIHVFSQ